LLILGLLKMEGKEKRLCALQEEYYSKNGGLSKIKIGLVGTEIAAHKASDSAASKSTAAELSA
jgi:hypothetical protein